MTGPLPLDDVATLREVAALQDLDLAPDLSGLSDRLADPLERYVEFELRSDGRRIDLVTTTESPTAVREYCEFLEERGLQEGAVDPLADLGRFGAGRTIGLKLPVAGPLDSGELYVRTALPLAELRRYLDGRDPGEAALETAERVADAFGKGHAHMLAAEANGGAGDGADSGPSPTYTCLFTTWIAEDSDHEPQLRGALSALDLPDEVTDRTLDLHELLAAGRRATLFASVPLPSTGGPARIKLDYPDVRLGLAAEAAARVGPDGAADRVLRAGELFGASQAGYASVVVGRDGPEGTRAYFTRRSEPGI